MNINNLRTKYSFNTYMFKHPIKQITFLKSKPVLKKVILSKYACINPFVPVAYIIILS